MRDAEFITFGVVLIVWEVLPTFMVILFFRVRRPNIGDMVCKTKHMFLCLLLVCIHACRESFLATYGKCL